MEAGPALAAKERRRQLVLAVEDERHDWEIYGKMLWYNGFDVVHAEDAESALELVAEHHPDAILADLMLPGMDGLELCRCVKQNPETAAIPIVLLTARTRREFGEEADRVGCACFLEKPISPVSVLHTVEDLVGRPPPPAE